MGSYATFILMVISATCLRAQPMPPSFPFPMIDSIMSISGSGNGIASVANTNPSPNTSPRGAGGAPNNPSMETVQNPNRFAMSSFLGQPGRPGTDFSRSPRNNNANADPNNLVNVTPKPPQPIKIVKMPQLCPGTTMGGDSMVVMPMPMSRMKTAVGTLPMTGNVRGRTGTSILTSGDQMFMKNFRNHMMSLMQENSKKSGQGSENMMIQIESPVPMQSMPSMMQQPSSMVMVQQPSGMAMMHQPSGMAMNSGGTMNGPLSNFMFASRPSVMMKNQGTMQNMMYVYK